MLVYEKNNKLNINFDNEVNENPDLQIGKEDGKTQVLIDGQPGGGSGGSSPLILEFATEDPYTVATPISDIKAAIDSGRQVYFYSDGNGLPLTQWRIDNNNNIMSMDFGGLIWSGEGVVGVNGIKYSSLSGWHPYLS